MSVTGFAAHVASEHAQIFKLSLWAVFLVGAGLGLLVTG
jgi:hypothetical protein